MRVKILKSVEGNPHEEVILDKKLVDALFEYNEANRVFNYLFMRGIMSEEAKAYIQKVIEDSRIVFNEYDLDKYDIRANYLFDESEQIE